MRFLNPVTKAVAVSHFANPQVTWSHAPHQLNPTLGPTRLLYNLDALYPGVTFRRASKSLSGRDRRAYEY